MDLDYYSFVRKFRYNFLLEVLFTRSEKFSIVKVFSGLFPTLTKSNFLLFLCTVHLGYTLGTNLGLTLSS